MMERQDELFELTESELDVVAGGTGCNPCNRCCNDGPDLNVAVAIAVAAAISL